MRSIVYDVPLASVRQLCIKTAYLNLPAFGTGEPLPFEASPAVNTVYCVESSDSSRVTLLVAGKSPAVARDFPIARKYTFDL